MAVNPPYLLIDIDGVLNPFPGPGGSVPPGYRPHRLDPNGHANVPVWLDADHGAWIVAARSMRLVRPVWATSWMREANRLVAPLLGMDSIPYIDLGSPDIFTPHPWGYLWKRDPVSAWIGDAPIVWIDDDFAPPDHEWARQRSLGGAPTLLIQPDPFRGLQRHHVGAVRMWAIAVLQDLHANVSHDDDPAPGTPLATTSDASRSAGSD